MQCNIHVHPRKKEKDKFDLNKELKSSVKTFTAL